jgi:hypothetical protein
VEQKRGLSQTVKARTQLDLQERVAKLESLLEASMLRENGSSFPNQISSGLDNQVAPSVSREQSTKVLLSTPHLDTESSPISFEGSTPDNSDPIVSLFDNAIVSCLLFRASIVIKSKLT